MNDLPSTPPLVPPQIPPVQAPLDAANRPLGGNPGEDRPILNLVSAIEALLRQPRRVMFQLRQPRPGPLVSALLVSAIFCALTYGLVVGTFSGGTQLWAAPVKIAGGLLLSALICLPSLYIFSCLGGSQGRLVEVLGLLAGLLALMTVLLIGFAPVAWVFSQTTESLTAMGALHLSFWLLATYFGLRFLDAGFRHLSGQAGGGRRVWTVLFLLVALQMSTALRPIVGTADTFLPMEKKFFLSHWRDNFRNDGKADPIGKTR